MDNGKQLQQKQSEIELKMTGGVLKRQLNVLCNLIVTFSVFN